MEDMNRMGLRCFEERQEEKDRIAKLRLGNVYHKRRGKCRICGERVRVSGITEHAAYHCSKCDTFYDKNMLVVGEKKTPKKERSFKYKMKFDE